MTQAISRPLSFEEFIELYPEDGKRYEFVNGHIIEMKPLGAHDKVADYIADVLKAEARRLDLDYEITGKATIRVTAADGETRGRTPDVSVIADEIYDTYLDSSDAIEEPIQMAIEVCSQNFLEDYRDKLDEYERKGIAEYWVVDYKPQARLKYLNPQVPTVFVYALVNGSYEKQVFQSSEAIASPTFPELALTVDEVVKASQPRQRRG